MTAQTARPKISMTRRLTILAGLLIAATMLLAPGTARAAAASAGPGWAIQSIALPTSFSTSENQGCEVERRCDDYLVTATNVGGAPTPASGTITIKDVLPAGVALRGVATSLSGTAEYLGANEYMACGGEGGQAFSCTLSDPVAPGGVLAIRIPVTVTAAGQTAVTNYAEVEGGGAATVKTSEPSTVANVLNGEVPAFGLQDFAVGVYGAGGASDDQAGDHPAAVSTTIDYNTELEAGHYRFEAALHALRESRSEIVDLPLGFAGDPLAAEQCPVSSLYGLTTGEGCPAASQIGTATIERGGGAIAAKIYNLVPEAGYPAMFGFEVDEEIVVMRARVLPTSAGYVLSVSVPDVPRSTSLKITGVTLTFFGDPAEQDGGATSSRAFFTNPTDCSTGPLKARLEMDSWVDPGDWVTSEATMYEAGSEHGLGGCDLLQFDPTLEVTPETTERDTPSGYEVDLKVPQAPNLYPAPATPDLRNAEVTLPEGVSVSPGAAAGLAGCRESGPEGIELGDHDPLGHEIYEGEEEGADGLAHPAPGHCPAASRIGTVEIATPLLATPLKGHVYLAQPECGGAGQEACNEAYARGEGGPSKKGGLFGIYLEAEGSGVIVKLRGEVEANPQSGHLTTRFAENPQLPFSELKLRLNGGPRAPLANPQICGQATTTSALEPWSAPESGPAATPFSAFQTSGCAGAMPFAPGFLAQTATPLGGAFSPFTVRFSREDGEQTLSSVTVSMPPGLLGVLEGVEQCSEPQASQGACGAASLIGHDTVAAGAGSAPFWEQGSVYLTGPYDGAPFGLSIVTPTQAGPFNLGNVVVRAAIDVNPETAALTVTSSPLPQVIDGVPLRIQTVDVDIDRPKFTFNPTNCSQRQIAASIASAQGATASVSRPFAATGCANLPFKPVFTASTQAKTSKAHGASLKVNISSPGVGQAGIAKVDLTIPKILPSRLTTLQKACTEAQFDANPAGCPAASDIATAIVHTPILSAPLTGPVYFVSRGGAAFPDVEIVLQGEGVKLILDGHTDIKNGVTYSKFETVPDAPFTTFEFDAPEGPDSIFTTEQPGKTDLCAPTMTKTVTVKKRVKVKRHGYVVYKTEKVKKQETVAQALTIPTTIVAQSGAVIEQDTKVVVTDCAKAKPPTRAQKLRAALRACARDRQKAKHRACERRARKQHGA